MKKWIAAALVGVLLLAFTAAPVQAEYSGRGGFMGFIAGCCFGIRTGAAYNEGKEIHWREWVMLVPIVSIVFAIMNGIDGMQGVTTSELAQQYGSSFY
jgi:hypothetical protein